MVFEVAKQVELSIRCIVKGYHKCPFEVNIGEKFYARREENVGMRSKLPMIGGSSATFKLVLFGPYTKRLLCKFEKKLIEMCGLNPQYSFYFF